MYTLREKEKLAYISGAHDPDLYAAALKGEAIPDVRLSGYEVSAGFAAEDCLQDQISHAQSLARGKVTQADVKRLVELLEEKQSKLSRAAEYGKDELEKLECGVAYALA